MKLFTHSNIKFLKMLLKLLIFLVICGFLDGQQFYFPDDSTLLEFANGNFEKNLTQLRGTSVYENFVDGIIANGVLKLTLAIDKALNDGQQGRDVDNIVYAPISITGALALVLLGSNGKTFQEISSVLGLASGIDIQRKSGLVHEQLGRLLTKLERTSGFEIGDEVRVASAIFIQNNFPIRNVYKQTSENVYKSEVLNVDFNTNPVSAQNVINAWVNDRTNSKIKNILSEPPPSNTKLIIASALYFKAKWEKPFFAGTTKRKPFYPNGKNSKSSYMIETMINGGTFPYYKDTILNCEILGFPYKGNKTTMYVILPNDSDRTKLKNLEEVLTPSHIERLVGNTRYTGAVILFPKMTIESTIDLKDALQKLGLRSLFDSSQANLALLSPGIGNKFGLPNVEAVINPIKATVGGGDIGDDSVLIFSRMGVPVNCTEIFNPESDISSCQQLSSPNRGVVYKKFGNKVGRRIVRRNTQETVDSLREYINSSPNTKVQNPGLYADKVLHKVFMDITESGTEAAAVTAVSLSRDGGRVTFRVDVPFLFFIYHEETKMVLFWGSVTLPTPNFPK